MALLPLFRVEMAIYMRNNKKTLLQLKLYLVLLKMTIEEKRPMTTTRPRYIHGTLEAFIFHATSYTPSCPFNWLFVGEKPAYVTIKLAKATVAKTSHQLDRTWNESFHIICAHPWDTVVTITLRTNVSVLGKIKIQAESLLHEFSSQDGVYCLFTEKGKQIPMLKLRFRLSFRPAELDPQWGRGLKNHNGYTGLTRAVTFHQRQNCGVTLYQDAHHKPLFNPPIGVVGSELKNHQPRRLWEDVYKAMDEARHLIYIAGWSLNPEMVLVRDPETELQYARGTTIGELLKRKASEGVAVRIMLWDDETSLPFINNKGVMNTHDEDAFHYFKHTQVICKLCPRLHHKFPTEFAHHQKTISVDANEGTQIMSFVGGLDLCDGRYDTEEHSLFRTLNTGAHASDFYQTSIGGASLSKGGPREPWHDVHACITGEAAWDVLHNFAQRWTKQFDLSLLLPAQMFQRHCSSEPHADHSWNVQVFRSIDHNSASNLPEKLRVERSIHEAYVEAIRRAEKFIYIENQYFIGGCHLWEKDVDSGCSNLIPVEIALKVASKIRAGERFSVYIVIPMWPEGVPESEPVQDILHWTRLTMKMMYGLIAEAIRESGEMGHPQDYLNFFCLANKEVMKGEEFVPPCSPQYGSQYWEAQRHRRFMIYVHSKLMIVDDEYVIMGSANINQRSMDGRRDTEIAIGCYQPMHVGVKTNHGAVHAYRMSLWYEHTRRNDEVFLEPQSIECVRRMCSIGEEMWNIYMMDTVVDMEGVHLVKYPVSVSVDGLVGDIMQCDGVFPDTQALIRGRRSKLLPPTFTT